MIGALRVKICPREATKISSDKASNLPKRDVGFILLK